MKLVDKLKIELCTNIYTNEELDCIMEKNEYFPLECDEEIDEGVLKYTNSRSQLWVKYIREDESYLVSNVTMRTKKNGKTKVRAFHTVEEIKGMMDYFRDNEKYDEFLIFMLGLFLARRVGDTLSLKWSDFYYENGKRKETLNTLVEDKTGKMIDITLTDITWKYMDWYCETVRINPMDNWSKDIFQSRYKDDLHGDFTEDQYKNAIDKQAACFRYEFKKAAKYNNIDGVSTHSMRKSFGYIAHEINKFDPDFLPALQSIYGHVNLETTKIYIDVMAEKGEKIFNDVGKYVEDIDNGVKPAIDNTPIIALKTNDLRDILIAAYRKGMKHADNDPIEIMNELLSMVENKRVA